jgi:hypothetical protein
LTRPAGRPFWSEAPRLLDRVTDLLGQIDRTDAVPTQAQLTYWAELVIELRDALGRVNAFLEDGTRKINAALSDMRLPPVYVPDQVKMPELEKIL